MNEIDYYNPFSGISAIYDALNVRHDDSNVFHHKLLKESWVIIPTLADILEELEHEATEQTERLHNVDEKIDYKSIQRLFAELKYENLHSILMGLDFDLELRESERLVTENRYPSLWMLFVKIPGDRGHGLENENHGGHDYHIHYIEYQRQRRMRTDVVFTFNPHEPLSLVDSDTLYWFKHGIGRYIISKNPSQFGIRRRFSIHSCALRFIKKGLKMYFRSPPGGAGILYP